MTIEEAIRILSELDSRTLIFSQRYAVRVLVEHARRTTWQPIETAPKDKVVLVFADVPTLAMFRNDAWREGFWTSHLTFATIRELEGEVTHWMPLPEPPKEVE